MLRKEGQREVSQSNRFYLFLFHIDSCCCCHGHQLVSDELIFIQFMRLFGADSYLIRFNKGKRELFLFIFKLINNIRYQACPAGLMAGSDAGAVVPVEILVE